MEPDPHGGRAPWSEELAQSVISRHLDQPGALLPILHELQAVFGYVPPQSVPLAAEALNLSRAEVHGVVSYYKDFRSAPGGDRTIRICRAEACRSMGSESLARHACERLGVAVGETTGDGAITLEQVFCLGNCALAPAVTIDGVLYGRAGEELLDRLPVRASGDDSAATAQGVPEALSPEAMVRVYVPGDSAATSVGADEVARRVSAEAAAIGRRVEVIRTGTRGLLWLEPLVEVAVPGNPLAGGGDGEESVRIAYGPVTPEAVGGLVRAGMLDGTEHPLRLGPPGEIPFLAAQKRITFARVGVVDPLSFADYEAHGGLVGLRRALAMSGEQIVEAVAESGLRGRGGAGFPAGIKWRTVLDTPSEVKYVACNADEGDSGTFADRILMEGDALSLLEGMVIAGLAVGAAEGYVYIRSEYPAAFRTMSAAAEMARLHGMLGPSVLGSGRRFDVHLRMGAGSYVCGEETAMLESLEGKRGMVRPRPPVPAVAGLFGRPTIVNNVLTLAAVPSVLADGPDAYRSLGSGRSRGTQVFQLAGNVKHGGIFEAPFGVTIAELVEGHGGGTASGRPARAVQVGGPLGAYLPAASFGLQMDYEVLAEAGGMLGHGGVVVFDDTVDMGWQARLAMEFCAEESCGKCTPCRVGSVRGMEVIDRVLAASGPDERDRQLALLAELCETMVDGSLCAMGGLTPVPVQSILRHFPEDLVRAQSLGGRV